MNDAFLDRFFAKMHAEDWLSCWVWTGAKYRTGYGSIGVPGTGTADYAHRVIYRAAIGPIPPGLQIDHLCMVRACVNPLHLEAVTQRENVRRAAAARLARPLCRKGHPYTDLRKQRICNTCRRERANWRRFTRRARGLFERARDYELSHASDGHPPGTPCFSEALALMTTELTP